MAAAAPPPGRGPGAGFRRDGGGDDQDLPKKNYSAYPNVDDDASESSPHPPRISFSRKHFVSVSWFRRVELRLGGEVNW